MPKFAANLTMQFNEVPFLQRFEAAADAGFRAVEFLLPYAWPAADIAALLSQHGLKNILFNMAAGDWDAGERGLAALPGREADFLRAVDQGIAYAKVLGTPNLHVMAGLVPSLGGIAATEPAAIAQRKSMHATYVANLRHAAAETARHGITLLIEPINGRDMPGYFLATQAQAHAIRAEVGAPNLKVQMDFYHVQMAEGDIAAKLRDYLPHVGHVQIAGVPGRHEPDVGEINYPYLFSLLDELGYDGWVGCEYRPRAGTVEGLGWLLGNSGWETIPPGALP
jgi:hydroxypyruvate isomerase